MKTKTWVLALAALLIICIGLSVFLLMPGSDAAYATVFSHGQTVKTVDLRIDQEFTVDTDEGGLNRITVKDGRIAVTEANCPDHYCMARGFCSSGAQIVCLPNQLVIRFESEQIIDGVVG